MKVLREGHLYELQSFEGGKSQKLQFIEKIPITEGSTKLKTVNDGTTNEELLKVLINRMHYLNKKMHCRENLVVITKLEESLMWLEKRTGDRIARNVEGKKIF